MPVVAFLGGMIGPWELGIILVIVLILFGAGRLPQVFESFGKGIKAFRDAQKDEPLDVGTLPQHDDLDSAHEVEKHKERSA
jgi:sec-independent protein translocase protein TatA